MSEEVHVQVTLLVDTDTTAKNAYRSPVTKISVGSARSWAAGLSERLNRDSFISFEEESGVVRIIPCMRVHEVMIGTVVDH